MGLFIHSIGLEKLLNKTNSNPIQGIKTMKTTMNSLLIAVGVFAFTAKSFADVGIVETTAAVNNGTGTVYVSATGGGANPRWSGYNFGTFDLGLTPGSTLNLTNFYFENYAYNGGAIPPGGSFNDNWLATESTATFKLYRDSRSIKNTPTDCKEKAPRLAMHSLHRTAQ